MRIHRYVYKKKVLARMRRKKTKEITQTFYQRKSIVCEHWHTNNNNNITSNSKQKHSNSLNKYTYMEHLHTHILFAVY